jgi:uncharacterized protein
MREPVRSESRDMPGGGNGSESVEMPENREVRDNVDAHRYELVVDGNVVAIAVYHLDGNVLVLPHTEVVAELRGNGLGEELIHEVLERAGAAGRRVAPRCWFVREYIELNPEFRELVG